MTGLEIGAIIACAVIGALYIRESLVVMRQKELLELQQDRLAVAQRGVNKELAVLRQELDESDAIVKQLKESVRTSDEMLMACLTLMSSKRDNKRWAKAKIKEWFGGMTATTSEKMLAWMLKDDPKRYENPSQDDGVIVGTLEKVNTVQVGNHTVVVNGPITHETVGPEC